MPTTYPSSSVVYVTDSLGQGSGVLISPDEVLTAAHVVYDPTTGLATDVSVSPGYGADGATPFNTIAGTATHSEPVQTSQDSIALDQSEQDFAVIHLSEPVVEAGTMALGAGFGGGIASLSGYPYPAGGNQVTVSESFSQDPSYSLLTGSPILGPYDDSAGSSGGPVWHEVNGVPTVVGLVSSSEYTYFGEVGHFLQLTAQDLSTIHAWTAADDAGESFGHPSGLLLDSMVPIAAASRSDAASDGAARPFLAARDTEGANALDDGLYASTRDTSLDDLFGLAEADAAATAPRPALDTAFLAGLAYGLDGGAAGSLFGAVQAASPGLLAATPLAKESAILGFRESQRLGAGSSADLAAGAKSAPVANLHHPASLIPTT